VSQLTVSKLAEEAGTSSDTVRYYERIGLLPETERSASGYRLYGPEAVDRLRFIKRAQRFGLRLEAIAELLDIREHGQCPCGHTRRLLEARMAELDEEMSSLARLRADVARLLDGLPDPGAETRDWRCTSDLMQIGPGPSSLHDPEPKETP
jgi:DNA-binding transcriptional MerR regulator